MTFKQTLIATLTLTLLPLQVSAAVPSNIRHVQAQNQNGVITVSWQAPADTSNVDFYRVYYNHESILDHQGNYDDSVRTQGNETTYVFKTAPLGSEAITFAVLAVSKDGSESDGFETEAVVTNQTANTPASLPTSAPTQATGSGAPVTAIPMTVTNVHAVSETGVLITFSKQVLITMPLSETFFRITDASGAILAVTAVTQSGGGLLLHTQKQETGKTYEVSILQPIAANDGTNLALSPERYALTGFDAAMSVTSSSSAMSSSESSSSSSEPPYVKNPILDMPAPTVTEAPTPEKTDLPKSGVGLLGISIVSGMLSGRTLKRRKK